MLQIIIPELLTIIFKCLIASSNFFQLFLWTDFDKAKKMSLTMCPIQFGSNFTTVWKLCESGRRPNTIRYYNQAELLYTASGAQNVKVVNFEVS